MQVQIVNTIRVTPRDYWQRIFFDHTYHRGLYEKLGFPSCEIERLDTDAEGRVRRVLRAVPPINAPEFIRKKLAGRLFYIEDGTYDPQSGLWHFKNQVNLAADSVEISGVIRTEPERTGLRHVLDLRAKVNAFGLGSLFERLIEKNTRESYNVMREFTNAFAQNNGLAVAG